MKKKGLSDVVTTLIIILLALVAIAVIWVVASSILDKGKDQIDLNQNCIGMDFDIDAICGGPKGSPLCNVTVERLPQGSYSGDISGVKIIFINKTGDAKGPVIDKNGTIDVLGSKKFTSLTPGIDTPKGVQVFAYFKTGEKDSEHICAQAFEKYYD